MYGSLQRNGKMSFLARRGAASEGAFFSQTSKEAIVRLREKAAKSSSPIAAEKNASLFCNKEGNADVLPEILQHSLPEQQEYAHKLPTSFSPSPSSLVSLVSATSSSSAARRRLDTPGLSFLPTLPQASFGPRRWTPPEDEVKIVASTANEARLDGMLTIDDAKAKELVEGYAVVLKAFLVATAIVVGGATLGISVIVSKLQIHSLDDFRIKGYEHMQPRVEAIRRRFEPWKQWVQRKNRHKQQQNAIDLPAGLLGLKQLADEVEDE